MERISNVGVAAARFIGVARAIKADRNQPSIPATVVCRILRTEEKRAKQNESMETRATPKRYRVPDKEHHWPKRLLFLTNPTMRRRASGVSRTSASRKTKKGCEACGPTLRKHVAYRTSRREEGAHFPDEAAHLVGPFLRRFPRSDRSNDRLTQQVLNPNRGSPERRRWHLLYCVLHFGPE